MAIFKETERITLCGSFGDHELRIEKAVPNSANGIQLVFLHGVHSCANLTRGNKYRVLAREMCERGFTCWLTETTRKIHNRDDFKNAQPEWIKLAFSGKTYAQELADVKQAVQEIIKRINGAPLWLWGFSLGGISAVCCAADADIKIDRLIVAGSGVYPRKKMEWMYNLPIMNTLRSDIDFNIGKHVKTESFIAFRGQFDEIFPLDACRKLYSQIKVKRGQKLFYQLEGADHAIRMRNGVQDDSLLKIMADIASGFER